MSVSAITLVLGLLPTTPLHTDSLPPGALRGRILTPEGQPVVAASVLVEGTLVQGLTGPEGAYHLRQVPSGPREILVTGLGIAPTRRRAEIPPGQTLVLDIEVPLMPVELAALEVTTHRLALRQTAPLQTLVVDRAETSRFNDATLGELLRRTPGVVIGGPPGEAKDLRIRGLDKEYTLVLVDGRRMPDGGEKREFALDRLPAALVERVEVYRNPTASLPSQGVGGAVNVVLKDIPPEGFLEWETGTGVTGSPDSAPLAGQAFLHAGHRMGSVGWLLSGGWQQRYVPKEKRKIQEEAEGRVTGREGEEEDRRFLDLSLRPRLSWVAPSGRDRFTFTPLLLRTREDLRRDKDKRNAAGALQETETSREVKTRSGLRLEGGWTKELSGGAMFEVQAGVQESREEKDRTNARFKGGTSLDRTDLEREAKDERERFGTVRLRLPWLPSHTLTLGTELTLRDRSKDKRVVERRPSGQETTRIGPRDRYDLTEREGGSFLADEWRLTPRQIVTAGIRLEYVDNQARAADRESPRQQGWFVARSAHYLLAVTPSLNLRAAAAQTTRRPKFDDLVPYLETRQGTLLQPDKVGNPALRPEEALSFEVGLERFFAKAGVLGLTVFRKRLEDRIEAALEQDPALGRWVERPLNIGRGTLAGAEVDVRASLDPLGVPGFTLYGNVALYRSRLRVADAGRDRPFDKQPSYVLNLGFDQALTPWGIHLGANFNRVAEVTKEEMKDGHRRLDLEDTGDFLDVYLSKTLPGAMELRFGGRNLLEADKRKEKLSWTADGTFVSRDVEGEGSRRTFHLTLRRKF